MYLIDAFRTIEPITLACVGSGGKTTAIFQLARQLKPPVIVSSSTHLACDQLSQADQHLLIETSEQVRRLFNTLEPKIYLLTGEKIPGNKVCGPSYAILDEINTFSQVNKVPFLIEADGSRQRPLKAPSDNEPAIPGWCNVVMVCTGLQGVGKPLSADFVHRPEQFSKLIGKMRDEEVTLDDLGNVMCTRLGGLKNIPSHAMKIALLNQADDFKTQSEAGKLARRLSKDYDSIVIASLKKEKQIHAIYERVGAIILAAGSSSRFGEPKQLLRWRGKPLVWHVSKAALRAGLDPVIVVLGDIIQPIKDELINLNVHFVVNENWQSGQSGSIIAGLNSLPGCTGATVFLMADQPLISVELLRSLVETHRSNLDPIVAPEIDSQTTSPVLFDKCTFTTLKSLAGDFGGRTIFSRFAVTKLPWFNSQSCMDIDTPEDFQRLLSSK